MGLIPENELTRDAGIAMDPRTSGAMVYENMETSLGGIFASGNVVHVHDLVDFVTAESQRAGAGAAQYVLNGPATGQALAIKNGTGVTYTVPQHIRPANIAKAADVFFRVNRIYGESVVQVMDGETVLAAFKREHLAPGEMEHIMLPRVLLDKATSSELTVSIQEK